MTAIQEQRRNALIEATCTVIARAGVDNATVREIAREAGCTTGSLWHHFRGRDDLIVQTLDRLAAAFFADAEQRWQAEAPGRARLRSLIISLAPTNLRQRDRALTLFRVWSGASSHVPTARALRKHFRRLRKLVLAFIEESIDRGELAAHLDSSVVADALIALGDGLCVSRTLGLSKHSSDMNAPIDAVLDGFSRKGP